MDEATGSDLVTSRSPNFYSRQRPSPSTILRVSQAAATGMGGLEGCLTCHSVTSTLRCPSYGHTGTGAFHVSKESAGGVLG